MKPDSKIGYSMQSFVAFSTTTKTYWRYPGSCKLFLRSPFLKKQHLQLDLDRPGVPYVGAVVTDERSDENLPIRATLVHLGAVGIVFARLVVMAISMTDKKDLCNPIVNLCYKAIREFFCPSFRISVNCETVEAKSKAR
jgi:hypothetical protein